MTKVTKKFFYSINYKDYEDRYEIEVKYPNIDYSIEDVAEETRKAVLKAKKSYGEVVIRKGR